MNVGTKSLLFGAHQFLIHPICVYIAWVKLYKVLPSLVETLAIFVHDWGYWGCPDMDGEKGGEHPRFGAELAANIMCFFVYGAQFRNVILPPSAAEYVYALCRGHSRHYAKRHSIPTSSLMAADKFGTALLPWWVYIPMAWLSGELAEYRAESTHFFRRTAGEGGVPRNASHRAWYRWLQGHMRCVAVQPDDVTARIRAATLPDIKYVSAVSDMCRGAPSARTATEIAIITNRTWPRDVRTLAELDAKAERELAYEYQGNTSDADSE